MTQFEMITRIKAAGITYPADLARMIEVCQEIQEDKRMDKFEAEIRAAEDKLAGLD